MKKLLVCLFLLIPVPLLAQTPTPAIPSSVDILVLPPGSDPATAAPVGTRNTPIGATLPNCNIATLPAPGPTPLVNPTKAYFDDPFAGHTGRFCQVDMPTGLPNNTGYIAVAVAKADSCTVNGSTITPCPSPRSLVGVPPFNIQPVLTPPAGLINLVIRP